MPQSRILIFCGKGGVGKTTLSLAFALRQAQAGKKVVVVSSHPIAELAVAVSLDGLKDRFPAAAERLFVVHIDPRELLAEVVENNFPGEWLARQVLDSQIYKNLIEVAPGLKEFYFLARMQELAERTVDGAPNYDLLLWDAPATGHFVSTLDAARNFETFLTGPLAAAGSELARFFSSIHRIGLIPATTLEEMAIQETVEMCSKLEQRFQLRPAALVLNMVSPLALAPDAAVAEVSAAATGPTLRFAVERGLIEREHVRELKERLPAAIVAVERVRTWSHDLDLLDQIGRSLDALQVSP